MQLQDESWVAIPDLHGYEISTSARVRSWKGGDQQPHILEGRRSGDDIIYDLADCPYSIEDLMRWAFGDPDGVVDFELGHEPGEENRVLSQYEINEIILSEGHKPAHAVAEEFRIDSARVRGLWNGTRS